MLRNVLISLAAAILSACSSGVSRTVERPVDEVRAMIQANEKSLMLTHYFPSANHKTELAADGLVWRFTLNDRDYARMVITLDPKDARSTSISSHFEEVNDAVGPGIPFLRKTAQATSEEILTATLEGRPINHAMLQDQLKIQAAKDPQALARGYMEASAQMFKEIQATGGTFSTSSTGAVRSSQPYDKKQPYDRTPAYDRN
jgi:hypothetical protein